MGFWNHLGKAALVAAPYIAAPFTGGTSLLLTGAANAAEQRWAQHDAEQAIARGEEPSHFDRWLGLGANVAGMAVGGGPLGALGSAASTAAKVGAIANTASNAIGAVGQGQAIHNANTSGNINVNNKLSKGLGPSAGVVNSATGTNPPPVSGGITPSAKYTSGIGPSPIMPMGGYSYNDNPMNQTNQSNPNLAQSIFQGRQEAIKSQPFRAGYDVHTYGSDDKTPVTQHMPQIFDSNQGYSAENDAAVKAKEKTAEPVNPKKSQSTSRSSGAGRAGLRA